MDELLNYLKIMDIVYEDIQREEISAMYLAEHLELCDVIMDYNTWHEIIKLSVSFLVAK